MKRFAKILGTSAVAFTAYTVAFSKTPDTPVEDIPVAQTEPDNGVSKRFFRHGASLIPHKSKAHRGGEDAFVADSKILVVADGVGGWINQGVDSGLFSKGLVQLVHKSHSENNAKELKNILVDAVKTNKHIGTSTAVLAKFDTTRHDVIKTTNLGDSGYVLFRPNQEGKLEKLFRSEEQQWSFNFPYQCGTGAQLPYDAFDTEHVIQDNDIIVMASDGVFDNLYDPDVEVCVEAQMNGFDLSGVQAAAECISEKALKFGYRTNYESPFSLHAKQHGR